jgi:hypothetical protein
VLALRLSFSPVSLAIWIEALEAAQTCMIMIYPCLRIPHEITHTQQNIKSATSLLSIAALHYFLPILDQRRKKTKQANHAK